jgi:hypothetical protein
MKQVCPNCVYLLVADAYAKRTEDHGKLEAEICKWKTGIEYLLEARICLGTICPERVRAWIFADNLDGASFIVEMHQTDVLTGVQGGFFFEEKVSVNQLARDYMARIARHSIRWRFYLKNH